MVKLFRLRALRIARIKLALAVLFPCLIFIFSSLTLHAEDFQTQFNAGIAAFNSQKWDDSILDFRQALKWDSTNIAAHYNLALSYLKKENYALAAAYFRKTIELSPGVSEARQGLEKALAKLENKTIPHEIEFIETIRNTALMAASPYSYYFLFGLSFFITSWIWLTYLGRRRRVIDAEPPPLPISGFLGGLFWGLATLLLILKVIDMSISRGTIIESQVAVLASPGENQVELFSIYGGNEVIIRRAQDDWLQIQYPGGPSGWIKKESLLVTTAIEPTGKGL